MLSIVKYMNEYNFEYEAQNARVMYCWRVYCRRVKYTCKYKTQIQVHTDANTHAANTQAGVFKYVVNTMYSLIHVEYTQIHANTMNALVKY